MYHGKESAAEKKTFWLVKTVLRYSTLKAKNR